MILSHLPVGYLLAKSLKKTWQKFPKRQKKIIFGLFLLFSIFPDFDFLFVRFVSASVSHRQLLTHAFLPYFLILLILTIIYFFTKRKIFLFSGIAIFIGSVVGHLFLDAINSGVMFIYPVSKQMLGLFNLDFFYNSFLSNYYNLFVFTFELLFTFIAIFVFFRTSKFKKQISYFGQIFAVIIFIFLEISLIFSSQYLYHSRPDYFLDQDHDQIMNFVDQDLDGDESANLSDSDADNDGISNQEEFVLTSGQLDNKLYDCFRGHFLDVSKNFGLMVNSDLVTYSLSRAGIYLNEEMKRDFWENRKIYLKNDSQNTPDKMYFSQKENNILIFFQNKNWILPTGAKPEKGDIIIFGDPAIHLGILTNESHLLHLAPAPEEVKKNLRLKNLPRTFSRIDLISDTQKILGEEKLFFARVR